MYSNNILKCIYEIHSLSLVLDCKAKQFLECEPGNEKLVLQHIAEALDSIQRSEQFIVHKLNAHAARLSHSVSATKPSSVGKKK